MRSLSSVTPPARNISNIHPEPLPGDGSVLKLSSREQAESQYSAPVIARAYQCYLRLENTLSIQTFVKDSSEYFAATKRRKEAKGWPGPVFANQMGLGWTKLNAVRACTRCRVRHVKCSLIHTGGPCTHCRKRKETCETFTYASEFASRGSEHSLAGSGRVVREIGTAQSEKAGLALAMGPDDHEPFYPIGPQFGEDYHEECWAYCPQRQLNELGFRTSSASDSDSLSPTYSFEFECPSAPSLSSQPRSNEGYDGQNNPAQQLAERPWFTNHPSPHALVDRPQHTFSKIIQSPHRMSLSFILNSNGARY
ncbi:hypothetical protein H4Q26_005009 [Puccinia striiformis f. sp. tritici PST-130]|nr:hypothetical protein H4Q26_005009 [Puccinia striiformis f. sp. tritici PST-130]